MKTELFTVHFKKRFANEQARPLLVCENGTEREVPDFMHDLDLREGDGVKVSWGLISRLETKRVAVE